MSTCEIYLKCRGQEYATIPMRMSVLYDINNNIKTKSRIIDKSKTNCTHLFFYRNETITLIDLYVVLHPIDSKYMYMCVYSILCTCIKALYCFLVDEQFLFSKRLLSYSYEITQRHVGRGERREGAWSGVLNPRPLFFWLSWYHPVWATAPEVIKCYWLHFWNGPRCIHLRDKLRVW